MRRVPIAASSSPRDDLAALQRAPEELLDVLMRDVVADLLLHVELPAEYFLVCQAVG